MPNQLCNLRLALFTGNYNMVRDGPTQALNRLMAHVLSRGAAVRIYAPTVAEPAFVPTGDLVSLPSLPIPGRSEYRVPLGLPAHIRRDLDHFAPNLLHVASPDPSAHRAVAWARRRGLPVLASVHTRFDTYPRYYRMGWIEPAVTAGLRRFYRRCDALVAPAASMARLLREQGMNSDISIWSRGVDRSVFDASRRDLAWRRAQGIDDASVVIGFLGRLVMEKGLDVFCDTIDHLNRQGVAHRVLVVGEGPSRGWMESRLPQAVFAGFQQGADLGRAIASMDMLFNPSVTETFGNVTLEAMASSLPVVAARATGSESLVIDQCTGRLIRAGDVPAFAQALRAYIEDASLRRRHGERGEIRSRDHSWDAINESVAKTYVNLRSNRSTATAGGSLARPGLGTVSSPSRGQRLWRQLRRSSP